MFTVLLVTSGAFKLVDMSGEVDKSLLQQLSSDEFRRCSSSGAAILRVILTQCRYTRLQFSHFIDNAVHPLLYIYTP